MLATLNDDLAIFASNHEVVLCLRIARLRNHNGADDGNVDFRFLKKYYIQSLENQYKIVDLLVQKLLRSLQPLSQVD